MFSVPLLESTEMSISAFCCPVESNSARRHILVYQRALHYVKVSIQARAGLAGQLSGSALTS